MRILYPQPILDTAPVYGHLQGYASRLPQESKTEPSHVASLEDYLSWHLPGCWYPWSGDVAGSASVSRR